MGIYVYSAIIIISLVIEAVTSSLVAIWFVPSSIIGILLDLLNVNTAVQIVVFFVVSIVLMLLFYKKLRNIIESKTEKTGIDTLIGSMAVAEEDIGFMKTGRVKAGNMSWSACLDKQSGEIKKGDIVTVLAIDGVKLVCTNKSVKDTSELHV